MDLVNYKSTQGEKGINFSGFQPTFKPLRRCVSSFLGLNPWKVETRLLKACRQLGLGYSEICQSNRKKEKERDRRSGMGEYKGVTKEREEETRIEERGGEGK